MWRIRRRFREHAAIASCVLVDARRAVASLRTASHSVGCRCDGWTSACKGRGALCTKAQTKMRSVVRGRAGFRRTATDDASEAGQAATESEADDADDVEPEDEDEQAEGEQDDDAQTDGCFARLSRRFMQNNDSVSEEDEPEIAEEKSVVSVVRPPDRKSVV